MPKFGFLKNVPFPRSGAIVAMAFVLSAPALSQTQVVTAPEALSWHGDEAAPDVSGVWVRADRPVAPGMSKEGWAPWPAPLKATYAALWKKRQAEAAAGTHSDDPVVGCMPPGMPRFDTGFTGPMLITQTPGRVMLYRDGVPVRRVWLTGYKMPDAKDLESFSNGNAVGHYEGKDLVTDIRGIRDQPIDSTGVPHSDDLRITERFHRVDEKTLTVEVTLTDPTAYTRPMKSLVTYTLSPDTLWEPREFLCTPKTNYHPDAFVH